MISLDKKQKVYCCYEEKNKKYWNELKAHLALFKRLGYAVILCNDDIPASAHQANTIEKYIETADVILLLVSAYFIASDLCWETTLRALVRWKAEEVCVIPILVTPVVLDGLPIEQLQILPSIKKPISKWPDTHEAYTIVVRGIYDILCSHHFMRDDKTRDLVQWEDE